MRILTFVMLCSTLFSCAQEVQEKKKTPEELKKYQVAYFASGCFWCLEAIYETVDGVQEAESGYCGGKTIEPSYEAVCSGKTGHAETVKVYYDSSVVSYEELLVVFFNSHDPTTLNQQGPDSGTQYRSAIFYTNEAEEAMADSLIKNYLATNRFSKITTTLESFENFYIAEDYHQDYAERNQQSSYIRNVTMPRKRKFLDLMPKYEKSNP